MAVILNGVSTEKPKPFGYYLGCPQWTQGEWTKSIFPQHSQPREALRHYAAVFNTVEGNTTFYAWPAQETVEKWAAAVDQDFRFFFKFPQEISHTFSLAGSALEQACRFIEHLSPLGDRRGPLFLQLPAQFTRARLDVLYHFLRQLPRPNQFVVEVRDPELFHAAGMNELNALLSEVQVERAWMDTRALRASQPPYDRFTQLAMSRKPDLPVYPIGLGPSPVIRFVAQSDLPRNLPWLEQWADVFTQWLNEGRTPFFFAHYPGEVYAPQIAARFHELLCNRLALPPRPIWPCERQPSLFPT